MELLQKMQSVSRMELIEPLSAWGKVRRHSGQEIVA
jgi:hypothetical protein